MTQRNAFGTFNGVYIPSILTILGVIMYLRLGWVVGNVGLTATLLIITMASLITLLTALSIAATATNMRVGAGGAYYMISRSFGIEAGAAVGVPLYLAQALGVSFYVAGFSESLNSIVPQLPPVAISVVVLTLLSVLSFYSTDVALKIQNFIFLAIALSLASFFLGETPEYGLPVGDVPLEMPFWVVFSVFFPAVTGIEAGISMSGDLKDPAKSLPLGTLAAVLTGYVVYVLIAVFLDGFADLETLRANPMVMQQVALVGGLVVVGIWGATLSSALGALLGAPRTLQALSRDSILPRFIGVGHPKTDAPNTATIFTYLVSLGGVLLGDLDAIAPVLSMFFLTSYGMLNLIAGLEGFMGSPSWRPKFRTPWLLSIFGAAACFGTMLMIDSGATFVAAFCCFGIFIYMRTKSINARWGDMRRGILNAVARYSIYALANYRKNAKSWRPHLMVLSGSPLSRWYLIELADAISHGKGFLTVATVLSKESINEENRVMQMEESLRLFLEKKGVPALVEVSVADNTMRGIQAMVRGYGLGPLVPNTFIVGETEKPENFLMFTEIIKLTQTLERNLVIVRKGKETSPKKPALKKIDVWWSQNQQNSAFMLALAYMLQTSPEWRGSDLTLKTTVRSEEEKPKMESRAKRFLYESRMDSQLEVLVESEEQGTLTTIRHNIAEADLVFVGMRQPEPGESLETYKEYYVDILRRTQGYPTTCLVLAGEKIKFDEIFI
ncbi:MAG: hypothetical protein KDD51_14025 [Bdellovibrionales bacterium]|nr:hypothetical protein [Bdellovibrionales bacterium]